LLSTVDRLQQAAIQARRKRLGQAKENELRRGIDRLLALPNWQLRASPGAVRDVAALLIDKGAFAQIGVGLSANLLNFTAPDGVEELVKEFREIMTWSAENCGNWQAAGKILKEAISDCIKRQASFRQDDLVTRKVIESMRMMDLEEDKPASVRFFLAVLCNGLVEEINKLENDRRDKGGTKRSPLVQKWLDMIYTLRDDNDFYVAAAAGKVFDEFIDDTTD